MSYTDFVVFKESLSDIITSFKEKIETHFKNNKAIIIEFWYHETDFIQILFNLNNDNMWFKFQNNI